MKLIRSLIAFTLIFTSLAVFANEINIAHSPRDIARAGERVRLRIKVDNPENIDLVRLYFKSDLNAKFNFVNTRQLGKYIFAGQLPAATKDAKYIEYAFLIRDKSNKLIKTQKFKYEIKGEIPLVASKKPIKVFSELEKAPKSIEGFDDNIEMDIAESGAKLAVVAGLYETETTTAAASSSSTTTTAAGGGISTTVLLAAGAGGAAVIGIAASGGGSGGSGQTEIATVIEFQPAQYSGTYSWDCSGTENDGSSPITLDLTESDGVFSGTADYLGGQISITGTYDESTGAMELVFGASPTNPEDTFTGHYTPDDPSTLMYGTTVLGGYPLGEGCTSDFGSAGTITVYQ